MTEKVTRRSYTDEEDILIWDMVEGARQQGLELQAVYTMLADDLDRTEAAVAKRYADIKKKKSLGQEEPSLKSLAADMETFHDMETLPTIELPPDVVEYCKKDVEATLRMYEALKEAERKPVEQPSVSFETLVNKLEQVITEKIEMRIERDFYKKKFEELEAKYNKVRRLLED